MYVGLELSFNNRSLPSLDSDYLRTTVTDESPRIIQAAFGRRPEVDPLIMRMRLRGKIEKFKGWK